jgi:hypothetical protein
VSGGAKTTLGKKRWRCVHQERELEEGHEEEMVPCWRARNSDLVEGGELAEGLRYALCSTYPRNMNKEIGEFSILWGFREWLRVGGEGEKMDTVIGRRGTCG